MLTAKIALTSDCNLRCTYCLIDKDRGESMNRDSISNTLSTIIDSPGRDKSIGIYGGEPMLRRDDVEFLIRRARALGMRHGKSVRISVATNGLLLDERALDFFLAHEVALCVSIDGRHNDRARMYSNGRGSLKPLLRKLELVFSRMPDRLVMALQGVAAQGAESMTENFGYLHALGFRNVNLEVIQGFVWHDARRREFARGLAELGERVLACARTDDPVFLHFVNRDLRRLRAGRPDPATMEFDPAGRKSSIPYPFLHDSQDNARAARDEAFRPGNEVLALRQAFSLALARQILSLRGRSPRLDRYAQVACELGLY